MLATDALTQDHALGRIRDHRREVDQVVGLLRDLGVDPAELTVGLADRVVLTLSEELAGRPLEVSVTCACGCVNGVCVGADDLPEPAPHSRWLGPRAGLRAPTYADLATLPGGDVGTLVARCTVGTPADAPTPADLDDLQDGLVGPIATSCVECGAALEVDVDLVTLGLRRLVRAADVVDQEIHLLASAYGWDLDTIETLPRDRRRRLSRMIADGG